MSVYGDWHMRARFTPPGCKVLDRSPQLCGLCTDPNDSVHHASISKHNAQLLRLVKFVRGKVKGFLRSREDRVGLMCPFCYQNSCVDIGGLRYCSSVNNIPQQLHLMLKHIMVCANRRGQQFDVEPSGSDKRKNSKAVVEFLKENGFWDGNKGICYEKPGEA